MSNDISHGHFIMVHSCAFGTQPLSVKRSSPVYGFGSSTREQANKLFVSQEHTQLAAAGTQSPGPAVYRLHSSVGGKQPDGRKRDPPVWSMGKAERFQRPNSAPSPGPGGYKAPPAAVGPQVLGRFRTEPIAGFGTAERKHVRKVFISQAHQKTDMHGMDSPGAASERVELAPPDPRATSLVTRRLRVRISLQPQPERLCDASHAMPADQEITSSHLAAGPATYSLPASVGGSQPDSKMRSGARWGFATSPRDEASRHRGTSPGPGAYTLPQSVGPQPDSKKVRAPTPGFGASTRDVRAKIFISSEHEKGSYGMNSPGPVSIA